LIKLKLDWLLYNNRSIVNIFYESEVYFAAELCRKCGNTRGVFFFTAYVKILSYRIVQCSIHDVRKRSFRRINSSWWHGVSRWPANYAKIATFIATMLVTMTNACSRRHYTYLIKSFQTKFCLQTSEDKKCAITFYIIWPLANSSDRLDNSTRSCITEAL
jgi:hypothetical protein